MDTIADEALVIIPPEGGALALTLPVGNALAFFTKEGTVDPVLNAIRKELDAFTPDVSTAKGRKEIASIAFKVAQSKAYEQAAEIRQRYQEFRRLRQQYGKVVALAREYGVNPSCIEDVVYGRTYL